MTALVIAEHDNKTLNDAQQKQVRDINPFGPGGFAALPLPGQIVSKSTLTAIKPSPEQQSQLDDLQKEVDAKLDNGVLTVKISKKAEAQPRKIALMKK